MLKMQYVNVCITTLCDGAEDDEGGEDACVRTGAAVKGPAPAGSARHPTEGLRQVWIFRLKHC